MTDEFDEFLNTPEDEPLREEHSTKSKCHIPKAYAHLTPEQYKTAILRERFMAYSVCVPQQWMEFIRENENELRNRLDTATKRSFRSILQNSMKNSKSCVSTDDLALINSIFGGYERAVPPATISTSRFSGAQYEDPFYGRCPTRNPSGVIAYLRDCTYGFFWKFMHHEPDIGEFIATLNPDQLYELEDVARYQFDSDDGLGPQTSRHFKEEDIDDIKSVLDRHRTDGAETAFRARGFHPTRFANQHRPYQCVRQGLYQRGETACGT